MKKCKKCHVKVATEESLCPLCQNPLTGTGVPEVYPYIPTIYKKYFTFFRILLLVGVIISLLCIALDWMIPTTTHFSIFVVAGFACLFIFLKIALTKRDSVYRSTLWQMVVLSVIVLLWDYFTGFNAWSITYVIPILCIIASVNISILSIVMTDYLEENLIYFICIAFIGIIPIVFLITNIVSNDLPSIICAFLNMICFLGLLIFKWKDVKAEFIRRLHI